MRPSVTKVSNKTLTTNRSNVNLKSDLLNKRHKSQETSLLNQENKINAKNVNNQLQYDVLETTENERHKAMKKIVSPDYNKPTQVSGLNSKKTNSKTKVVSSVFNAAQPGQKKFKFLNNINNNSISISNKLVTKKTCNTAKKILRPIGKFGDDSDIDNDVNVNESAILDNVQFNTQENNGKFLLSLFS